MIEDNTTWYLGEVGQFTEHYRLAKYTSATSSTLTSSTINSKVGLLRFGELMSGQFNRSINNNEYWLINGYHRISTDRVWTSGIEGSGDDSSVYDSCGVKPTMNLKSNVVITGGDGTKNNPFTIELSS